MLKITTNYENISVKNIKNRHNVLIYLLNMPFSHYKMIGINFEP